MTWAIAELLAQHAGKVTVSNPMRTKAIASAKVKTDKVDARVLAQLGAADFLPEVWAPDEQTRALRRRIAHRASLVKQRTRLRNQVHAVLARNLIELDVTDLFGKKGRRLLAGSSWPSTSAIRSTRALRLHDALDAEIELRRTDAGPPRARQRAGPAADDDPRGRVDHRAVDRRRHRRHRPIPSPRHLVGYLGLDPRVRQSGEREARHGHISREGRRTPAGC